MYTAMYSRSHRAVAVLAVVVIAALAGACAAVPASAPAHTAMPPAASTAASGVEIRGTVLWGANPVSGARVDVRRPDWRANPAADSTIATTTSGEDGSFVFADVPAGEWTLVASWPTGEESAGATPPVDTTGGQPVTDAVIRMEQKLTLEEPDVSQPIYAMPTLRWSALPGAAGYRVMVIDAGTTEAVVDAETKETNYALTKPLVNGRAYHIVVSALDDDRVPVANVEKDATVIEVTVSTSTPAPDETPAAAVTPQNSPADTLSLPPVCLQDGLATYVNRELGVCFAIPTGFYVDDAAQGAVAQGRGIIVGQPAGPGPEPLFATLNIQVQPAEGKDLATLSEQHLQQYADVQIERVEATLGGEPAIILDPVPGRLSSRQIIAVHGPDKFYILSFWPSFTDTPPEQMNAEGKQAQAAMEKLDNTVRASFAFLPPPGVPVADGYEVRPSCMGGEQAFVLRPLEGYCFALPQGFMLLPQGDGSIGVYGPALDSSPDPVRATLNVSVKPANGQTTQEIVDAYVKELPQTGTPVKQSEVVLGGPTAIKLENVPSRGGSTQVMSVFAENLYDLNFQPDPAGFPQAAADLTRLYDTVMGSFTFTK